MLQPQHWSQENGGKAIGASACQPRKIGGMVPTIGYLAKNENRRSLDGMDGDQFTVSGSKSRSGTEIDSIRDTNSSNPIGILFLLQL